MSLCGRKLSTKPKWLRRKLPAGGSYEQVRRLVQENGLATVCQEAQCPNQFECFSRQTATFMILGDRCTRNCRFCAVGHMPIGLPDAEEPARVARAVGRLNLRYAVITSVTRDDLADGGASHFVKTIEAIRAAHPHMLIEVLIPDLQGNWQALAEIVQARPDVLNHNLETVSRLYPLVRSQADYRRSLNLLAKVKELSPDLPTKSGIMLGLGEQHAEIVSLWQDLREAGCDILTMGQYLQPTTAHLAVERFIPPQEFASLEQEARTFGFKGIASGPFIRSSYEAERLFRLATHQESKETLSNG